jgi:hypothetical protein
MDTTGHIAPFLSFCAIITRFTAFHFVSLFVIFVSLVLASCPFRGNDVLKNDVYHDSFFLQKIFRKEIFC